jgi:hypothetical protein
MPDFKSGCKAGKKHMVVKATTRDIDGVHLDGRDYKFQQGNSFYVKDDGAAREIEQEYGMKGRDQVVVAPINMREPCHPYRAIMPNKSWKGQEGNWVEVAPGKWRLV